MHTGFDLVNGVLARSQWPKHLPILARDGRERKEMNAMDVVPENEHELLMWANVVRTKGGTDHFRQFRFVHAQTLGRDLVEVAIQLQGFLKGFNLRPPGNWNGLVSLHTVMRRSYTYHNIRKREGAGGAYQHAYLTGGEHHIPFNGQCRALNALRAIIERNVGCSVSREQDSGKIYLRRRVFEKVRCC